MPLDGTFCRRQELDHPVLDHRFPKANRHFSLVLRQLCLVCIRNAVVHQTVRHFAAVVIVSFSLAEHAGFHIALAFSCAEKNIPSAATGNHALCNVVMLVLIAVARQFRMVFVPLKVRTHLVTDIAQICVIRQVVFTVHL